jgi:hypothetical protein
MLIAKIRGILPSSQARVQIAPLLRQQLCA